MFSSDDIYIQTHDKPQLCPTRHNNSGTIHSCSKLFIKVWFWSRATYTEISRANDRCKAFSEKKNGEYI